jgi:hypothetical protein
VLALNAAVFRQTGKAPLLSGNTYSYGFDVPSWDWDEIGRQIEETASALELLPENRAAYMRDMLDAFALMVREGQGDEIAYPERVSTYLQVPADRVPEHIVSALREELRSLLVQAGYPDDLSLAVPDWREAQTIEGDALIRLADSVLVQAREAMQSQIMALPKDHQVSVVLLSNYPYYAYSAYKRDYQGEVRLSGDIGWEIPAVKHSICHEAFPGHQTFSAITEQRFRAGVMPVEGTVYFGNTPNSPIFEGVSECGAEFLGLVNTIDDEIFNVYNRLCFAESTNVAFDCNADGLGKDAAIAKLVKALHVPSSWAEYRYHYVTDSLWCASFPHYWYGREFIKASYDKMEEHLPAFLKMVYTEPHTVRTLQNAIESYLNRQGGRSTESAISRAVPS